MRVVGFGSCSCLSLSPCGQSDTKSPYPTDYFTSPLCSPPPRRQCLASGCRPAHRLRRPLSLLTAHRYRTLIHGLFRQRYPWRLTVCRIVATSSRWFPCLAASVAKASVRLDFVSPTLSACLAFRDWMRLFHGASSSISHLAVLSQGGLNLRWREPETAF